MDKPIPFNRPSMVGKEIAYLKDAIDRGQLAGDGFYTKRCNQLIESLTGAKKSLITHSCTAALEMAAILANLGPGDEVIMPSFTFVSTANAVVLRGAIPVFVDIDADTLNIDPQQIEKAITPKTKAIFVVHYAGFPCDMNAISAIASHHKLIVVEDAAQALGSRYQDKPCGSLGDLAAFSFHETKNVISGEGGALAINRADLIERAEIIREKGTDRSRFFRGQVDKYTWVDLGSSFLPGELVASYLCAQLEEADRINATRLAIFDHYYRSFEPLEKTGRVRLPYWSEMGSGNGHMFFLLVRDGHDRDAFIAHMKAHGIGTPFHYVPLHSAPAGQRFGRYSGTLAITDRISETLVRLPMFFELGDRFDRVVDTAQKYFELNR